MFRIFAIAARHSRRVLCRLQVGPDPFVFSIVLFCRGRIVRTVQDFLRLSLIQCVPLNLRDETVASRRVASACSVWIVHNTDSRAVSLSAVMMLLLACCLQVEYSSTFRATCVATTRLASTMASTPATGKYHITQPLSHHLLPGLSTFQ